MKNKCDDLLRIALEKEDAVVIEHLKNGKLLVRFNGYNNEEIFYKGNILKGEWKNPMKPSVYGIGYYGKRYNKRSEHHSRWENMLGRCYASDKVDKYKTYEDCYVCGDWLNFSIFEKWCFETLPEGGVNFELDKDLLVKGNKVYSPDTCLWLPKRINQYINDSKGSNSQTGIKGVSPLYNRNGVVTGQYEVRCSDRHGKRAYLGRTDSLEVGSKMYADFKKKELMIIAEDFSEYLTEKTMQAIIDYQP